MQENRINNSTPNKKIEIVTKTDHNPLFTKFWQELRAGKGIQKGEADVEEMVQAYTSANPLSQLSNEETEKIKEHLRLTFCGDIDIYNSDYKTLINDEIFLVNSKSINLVNAFFNSRGNGKNTLLNISQSSQGEKYKKMIESFVSEGVKTLTLEEKAKLFSDPAFLENAQYYRRNSGSSEMYATGFGPGSRSLTSQEGGYYSSNAEFLEEVEAIRKRTGKSKLKALDIGGNYGTALRNMKDLDSSIETFNLTIDEHPALFGDHIVRCPAEMMPAEFEEKMDLIDSQMAFRYFLYSDIALRNVIKSLSVGGVARIHYQIGNTINSFPPPSKRVKIDGQETEDRQKKLWAWIKTLVDKGYLDPAGSSNNIKKWISNPDENKWSGFVRLVKNKSTKNLTL